jgi:cell wall-associated NlpC family hydrolase
MPFVSPIVPVIPLRAEAAHRSEMVSQFLFGEVAEVLEKVKDFTKIRILNDEYIGWCQSNQVHEIPDVQIQTGNDLLNGDLLGTININGTKMHIPFGVSLQHFENGVAQIGHYKMEFEGKHWNTKDASFNEETINWITSNFLNTAYLWGGRTIFGIDCSGFTQQVFRFLNISLPRDAYQQAAIGEIVVFLQEATCGDLAFFDNAEGKITHVGIMLNAATIMHASGKVRIDDIDNMGIINRDTGERTHQLRIIKRYR